MKIAVHNNTVINSKLEIEILEGNCCVYPGKITILYNITRFDKGLNKYNLNRF
ncbi:unnamed protein product [marine sediment metagenome]|uniref:Uncharacterized protein n=1 Tax=marine sediment metagenome TaxID=412755 RepID=X0U010_9ZZZZ